MVYCKVNPKLHIPISWLLNLLVGTELKEIGFKPEFVCGQDFARLLEVFVCGSLKFRLEGHY